MTVGVIAEFRNIDLGSTLVKRVISAVEVDKTCGTIYLHVIIHNIAAIRFYEKLGFYRVKEIQDYYKIDGENHNCYLYAKYFHGKFRYSHWFKYLGGALFSLKRICKNRHR